MSGTDEVMSGSNREQDSAGAPPAATPVSADADAVRNPARRRALAKLGLSSAVAYVAPSLTRIDLAHGQTLLPTPCPPPGSGIPRPPSCPPGSGTPGGGPPGGPS